MIDSIQLSTHSGEIDFKVLPIYFRFVIVFLNVSADLTKRTTSRFRDWRQWHFIQKVILHSEQLLRIDLINCMAFLIRRRNVFSLVHKALIKYYDFSSFPLQRACLLQIQLIVFFMSNVSKINSSSIFFKWNFQFEFLCSGLLYISVSKWKIG